MKIVEVKYTFQNFQKKKKLYVLVSRRNKFYYTYRATNVVKAVIKWL